MSQAATPIPRYYRIRQLILQQIQDGTLKPGDQLPTEAELVSRYQISRITAKRALDELVQQGRAFRQQGRGTYVAQNRIHDISGFGSFTDDMTSKGLEPSSVLLDFRLIEPPTEIKPYIHLQEGESVFLIKRLRLANGEPVVVETAYVPQKLCPRLTESDLKSSLYAYLINHCQVAPVWAEAEYEARIGTDEETAVLKMAPGTPVLAAERITYTANYEVIEITTSVYRGDRYKFYSGRQQIN